MEPIFTTTETYANHLHTSITTEEQLQTAILEGISIHDFEQALSSFQKEMEPVDFNDFLNILLAYSVTAAQKNVVTARDIQNKILEKNPKLDLSSIREIVIGFENSPVSMQKILDHFLSSLQNENFKKIIIDYFALEFTSCETQENKQVKECFFHVYQPSESDTLSLLKNFQSKRKVYANERVIKKEMFSLIMSIYASVGGVVPNPQDESNSETVQKQLFSELSSLERSSNEQRCIKEFILLSYASLDEVSLEEVFQLIKDLKCPLTPILVQKMVSKWSCDFCKILEKVRETTEGETTVSLQKTAFLFMTLQSNEAEWVGEFLNEVDGKTFTMDREMWDLFVYYCGKGPYQDFECTQLQDGQYQLTTSIQT